MAEGVLISWHRSFGFIVRDDDGPDVFVHANDLRAAGIEAPRVGERFAFTVEPGRRGKPHAARLARA